MSGGKSAANVVSLFEVDGKGCWNSGPPHILFEELRQGEMLEGFCQLHAALIVSRLGSLTEPNLPVKNSAHRRTHTLMF